MTGGVAGRTVAISNYARLLTQSVRFLIVGLIVGAIAGSLWYAASPLAYSSTVTVTLQRIPTHVSYDPEADPARLVTIDTDAALLKSDEVRSAVAPVIGVSANEVDSHVTVTAAPLSDALNITVSSSSADRAENGAKTAATALLQQRGDYFVTGQRDQISYLQGRVARLRQVLSAARSEPLRIGEVQSIRSALDVLSPRVALTRRLNGTAGTLLNEPKEAVARRPSPVYVPVLSGSMCGLLIGLALFRLRNRLT